MCQVVQLYNVVEIVLMSGEVVRCTMVDPGTLLTSKFSSYIYTQTFNNMPYCFNYIIIIIILFQAFSS